MGIPLLKLYDDNLNEIENREVILNNENNNNDKENNNLRNLNSELLPKIEFKSKI